MLIGSHGNDVLHGDAGDDILIGNGGQDVLDGGVRAVAQLAELVDGLPVPVPGQASGPGRVLQPVHHPVVGQRIEPLVERLGVSGEELAAHLGHPGLRFPDRLLAILHPPTMTAHRIGIGAGHDSVHPTGQSPPRHRRPPRRTHRQ